MAKFISDFFELNHPIDDYYDTLAKRQKFYRLVSQSTCPTAKIKCQPFKI